MEYHGKKCLFKCFVSNKFLPSQLISNINESLLAKSGESMCV